MSIAPAPQLNIVVGANGSGKTSLLESLFFLSNGRSFRTNDTKQLVNFDANSLLVVSEACSDNDKVRRVALSYDKASSRVAKIDNKKIFTSSDLAKLLPSKFLSPTVGDLVTGSPKSRRKFMDWLMFHVEHRYLAEQKELNHVVAQRNALLRVSHSTQEAFWRRALVELSEKLYGGTLVHFNGLKPYILSALAELLPGIDVDISLYPGWNLAKGLADVLSSNLATEQRLGACRYGFHRRDIRANVNNRSASQSLSRGQLKLLAIALQIAQIRYLKTLLGTKCVVFIDDLLSELDVDNAENVVRELVNLEVQCFITSVNKSLIEITANNYQGRTKLFHVKRGVIMQGESL